MVYRVCKEIKLEASHRLLNYPGACRNIHGHSYKIQFTFEATHLDDMGMVLDFSDIKEQIGNDLMGVWDHCLLLNEKDPLSGKSEELGAICIFKGNPTAENMAAEALYLARRALQESSKFRVVKVRVYETETSYAEAIV